jgi:RNA polymerase I-specific transcription initiation factor RRN7
MREQKGIDPDAGGTKPSSDNPEESRSDDDDGSGSQSSSSSSEQEDPELAELLRENSELSSSDEDKGKAHASQKHGVQSSYRFVGTYDRPVNCIAVLVVACWTMRLPVMYKDFIDVIESYELPYLDFLRLLPSDMTCHLTKHAVHALSPHFPPSTLYIHRLASRLAKLMYANYGVFTPELNASPVLWRVVQQCLGGTPTLYRLAKKLGHILSLPLTLHHSLLSTLRRIAPGDPEFQLYDNVPPELALVATAIVVLKLVYGLDGKLRLPRDVEDPASALPNVHGYLSAFRGISEADTRHNEKRFSSRIPMSTGDMDLATIDEFLDFCERVLVKPQRGESDQQILDNYFPVSTEYSCARLEVVAPHSIVEGLSATKINVDETTVLQPGESYTIYHSRDVLGNLPEEQALIVTRSAKWVGVSEDYLCEVVERFERRLRRWYYKERRREKEEQESEGEGLSNVMED